jgi:hypothetical protein
MLPHGHLAVGYLVYAACTRVASRGADRTDLLVLLVATQLPDLVDKPLSWGLGGAFAGGRTVGHSLVLAAPVVVLVGGLLTRRTGRRRPAVAFAVGYLTHPLGDAAPFLIQGSLAGDVAEVAFLWWPVEISAAGVVSVLARTPLLGVVVGEKAAWAAATLLGVPVLNTVLRVVEVCLLLLAGAIWVRRGAPGARSGER